MRHSNRWPAVILLVLSALLLAACRRGAESPPEKIPAAHIEPIEGTELNRLLLTERAAERLDIQTAPVRQEQVNGTQRKVIPYSAVLYDTNGGTWAYTSPDPLTFVRQPITIDYIEGNLAILLEGPPDGTEVVTVGVSELYGIDTGVG